MKFDPKSLTEKAKKILEVDVEGLGRMKYGQLTSKDYISLTGGTTDKPDITYEQSIEMCWNMLNKAYPDLTLEDVMGWLPEDLEKVVKALFSELDFQEGDSNKPSV